MRRKTKRAFRYFFPLTLFIACALLFQMKSKKSEIEKKYSPQEFIIEESSNTGAKSLSLVSHNPQKETKLQINAVDAVQICDGEMTLQNPSGLLENTKGLTSLISKEAIYYTDGRIVEFYKNVNFTHYSGLVATTDYATVDTKTQDISGENGIRVRHKENLITAKAFELQEAGNLIKFNGNVCLNISRK